MTCADQLKRRYSANVRTPLVDTRRGAFLRIVDLHTGGPYCWYGNSKLTG
ncbi:hypothetical protein I5G97_gp071 [Mycobacterium phage Curiosium]|uniref:Uncharacterized protein n=1 Tax=Mycobacterium phage Curiosium TaxID=2599859 RepID=A0A5J6TVK1_9CAUD|nr:hypothetical protein I5G97_gp071 [Mycobacterium phage Curiosium]QFG14084.1 hypothetical protein PBI_CURIOSIUM_39 [Mycobacterium phage Curiosium]